MMTWIDALIDQLDRVDAPVLSLYLDVNPAHADNLKEGYRIRTENALKSAGAPRALLDAILAHFTGDPPHRRGRTLVLFATEDPDALFEVHYLQVDLPLTAEGDRVIARWGAPYVAPLLLARDDYERYAVVYMDRTRWRYYEVYLGEIAEVQEAFLDLDTEAWRRMTEPTAGSPALPAAGGGQDLYEARVEAWVHRFYKDTAALLEKALAARDTQRLILCGPEEPRIAFEKVLPRSVQDKVVARLPGLPHPDASPAQVLAHVEDAIEAAERAGEMALLERIRERGVRGLADVLTALQGGRLFTVAVPWSFEALARTVYRCPVTGFVGADEATIEAVCPPGSSPQPVRLDDVLPELALSRGTRLEFVRGEAARWLTEEMGGIAGLRRW